jgi:hypothetical protein
MLFIIGIADAGACSSLSAFLSGCMSLTCEGSTEAYEGD